MRWMFLWLILCLGIWAQAEDDVVPASIREHQWAYRSNTGVRYRMPGPTDVPDRIWNDLGRAVVRPLSDRTSRGEMSEEVWGEFLKNQSKSIDDIFKLKDIIASEYSGISGLERCAELEPIPTKEQLAWLRTLPDQWLAAIPEGYERRHDDQAYLSPWDILGYVGVSSSARFVISRRIMPKRELDIVGGAGCSIYWCEAPLTDEQVLIEALGISRTKGVVWDMELDRVDGQVFIKIAVPDNKRTLVLWPSGRRLVYLELPNRLFDTLVKPHLALHPSRWKDRFKFDLKDLVLRTLDESLNKMRENIDGPLEYLRYSFRIYPFDEALTRVSQVLVGGKNYLIFKNESVDSIHNEWFKTPVDRIQVGDYRAAMVAFRHKLIEEIVAERERISKDGLILPKRDKP